MLENYRILHELTRTQGGQLLLAQHLQTGEKVVIKTPLLQDNGVSHDEQLARFRRESDIHLYLRHESIVPAIEAFEQEQRPYLVTAYKPYPTLKHLLDQQIRFSPLEALNLVQQLCQALHYIHDQGVIHRDIHPENVLITEENRIYLMDFGCARKVFAPNITQEKVLQGVFHFQGTLYYMSPEQLLGQTDLDFRADVFSAGVMLYQLLTRQLPFAGEELQDMVQNLLSHEPHPIRTVNPYVPASLEQMVFQALRKDPDYRTPTARKLALEIEELLEDPELYYCEARWRLERQHSRDAAQDYSLFALQKNAYHLPSLRLLGQLFMEREQWQRAQRCYERMLERDPALADAHFALGQIEAALGHIGGACVHYERAWQLAPAQRDYRYALAVSLHTLGRKHQALEHIQALMEQHPDWVKPFCEAARLYEREDQKDAALAHIRRAHELAPEDLAILQTLGALQQELGLYPEALETWRQLRERLPEQPDIRHNLATIYYLLDELGESRRILEQLLNEFERPRQPDWEMSYRLLGFVYARLNLHDDAIEAYKYAILCSPEHLENYLFLASAYREQLQLEYAIHTLQYVSELPVGAEEATVYFLLARAYYEKGKEKDVMQALERCLACVRTLSPSMARQAEEDLQLLRDRERDRERASRIARFRHQGASVPLQALPSRETSAKILSFPSSRRRTGSD
ncbi:MAG: protein kinase domain-containing protein [Candidatus Sericytochromatia bacterium]